MVHLATKTLAAIDDAIKADQGATYRGWLGKVIMHMGDAYSSDSFPFRSHMGASMIGRECAREIWYGFRWVKKPLFEGRLLRLFNRGHLEEARFIAMLLTIGAEVYQQDENGNQFRISAAGGHFGGSGDGVVLNIPDLAPGTPALCEFKTSAEKPFLKLQKEGVRSAKFEHYVQMNCYMKKMGFAVALYVCVNKNTDELYGEIVEYNSEIADQFIDRGEQLVFVTDAPKKINESPGWFGCRFCDYKSICHGNDSVEQNCRTCNHSIVSPNGKWICGNTKSALNTQALDKHQQLGGCDDWELLGALR